MKALFVPGFVQIGTVTCSGIRIENGTGKGIENRIKIRIESGTGIKIEDQTEVENECGVEIKIRSVKKIRIDNESAIEIGIGKYFDDHLQTLEKILQKIPEFSPKNAHCLGKSLITWAMKFRNLDLELGTAVDKLKTIKS
ncbi:hypothetical protein EVAR_50064_1 [Eumeta japonica]|uniref:Uncharacterized protein n=1 Tax=Eumeta variegata TaxID=151549 RepID=A0A4C1XIX4_EUMVA|nr:hypothetical protein EVAR_50064_1 [Eumeta japonica]